ncbi:MAG: OsmC family protein [Bacteroidales bacterium]
MSEEDKKRQMNVIIHAESETSTRMKLRAGKFELIIDEPANLGGTDMGPSPVQVLLMALAGCLNVTGHEVAKQRGMKLNGIKIKIDGMMNPCTFIGCSFDERAGFQIINVSVHADFENASQEEIESWLMETEARCPVTDNIKDATKIHVLAN